jgi:hypothetical protein
MGLDQYAYVAAQAGDRDRYWDAGELVNNEFTSPLPAPRELAYWRKHPNLQGWMEQLWIDKGCPGREDPDDPNNMFNCVELELTWEDLDNLERAVRHGQLPKTSGFFYGDSSDEYYLENDLAFIQAAGAELFLGLKVFYNSSW